MTILFLGMWQNDVKKFAESHREILYLEGDEYMLDSQSCSFEITGSQSELSYDNVAVSLYI